jgi:hypothetical protein
MYITPKPKSQSTPVGAEIVNALDCRPKTTGFEDMTQELKAKYPWLSERPAWVCNCRGLYLPTNLILIHHLVSWHLSRDWPRERLERHVEGLNT